MIYDFNNHSKTTSPVDHDEHFNARVGRVVVLGSGDVAVVVCRSAGETLHTSLAFLTKEAARYYDDLPDDCVEESSGDFAIMNPPVRIKIATLEALDKLRERLDEIEAELKK